MPNDICFACNNSTTNGCSWARDFTPVKGWTAEEVITNRPGGAPLKTYRIEACPEFTPDKPGKVYCRDGYSKFVEALARDSGDEYRRCWEAYIASLECDDPDIRSEALARYKNIKWFMEGYERECMQICEALPKLTTEELRQLYVDEVLNDPLKDDPDPKVRLARAKRKAKIVEQYLPCKECKHHFQELCPKCDFQHSAWTPRSKYTHKKK